MNKRAWLLADAFGLVAAVLYFVSMADYAFPGVGAHLMAVWKGLEVSEAVEFPLMSTFAQLLGSGNLIAPVCGTIAVVMFFRLVAGLVSFRIGEERAAVERQTISLVAATAATLVFMLTPAVRSAATHVEPRLFDFTWLLLSVALIIPAARLKRLGAWLFPVALGVMVVLGFCDSVIFALLLPLFALLVALVARRAKCRPFAPVVVFLASAVLTFPVATSAFDVNGVELCRRSLRELSGYTDSFGWVFISVFATLPFVAALFSSGRAFREDQKGLVPSLFHLAMTFVTILAVATPLSPSVLMEPYGVLPVLSSAFAAVVSGYLIAYWWVRRAAKTGLVAGLVFTFVLVVSLAWKFCLFDGGAGAFADKVARKILADLGTRRWLVTDGTLDNHLKLVAAETGKDVNLVCLAKDFDADYRERLAKVIEKEGLGGSKNGALRLSLSLGVLPFVQDWFAADPSVAKTVAVFGAPDLWYLAGITPVPEFFFFGADESVVPDWSAWTEFDAILKVPENWGSYHDRKETNPVERFRFSLRRHLGFVANNRGVYLQDKKDNEGAFKMYELVLNEIDPDNICAIFNEVAMVGQNHPQAVAKKPDLERMLKSVVEDKDRRYLLWRLGTYYGYIRDPDMFIRLGHAWARSGRPGDALSQIRRAIDFVDSDKRMTLLNMMASLYASENDQAKSRRIFKAILAKNADDHDALIGMMRLELMEGKAETALGYLQRALATSSGSKRANLEKAMLAMMKGELFEARRMLRQQTIAEPTDLQAWSLLAAVSMRQIDTITDEKVKKALLDELETKIVPTMEKNAEGQFNYYLQTTKGFLLLRKGEEGRKQARDAFALAAKIRPDVATTRDMMLGLDISLNDKEVAEEHAREVLRRNRNAPLANYVMGSIALGQGKDAEAEMYLRKAAEAPQPVVLALNDLAEVLRRGKKFAEAERYARQATEKAPGLYVAWETLGAVLMDANGNLDEAEACICKACELSKSENGKETDVRMLVSLARVQLRRADQVHAKLTISKIRARLNELSDFEQKEFEEIAKGLR